LLTDGTNNRGEIAPVTAAEIAKSFGIRVYTIAVGTKGKALYPDPYRPGQYVFQPVEIDEKALTQIAQITGGQYFRATDNKTLKGIYNEIDQMEKTKISVQTYNKKTEEFAFFAMGALLFLLLEMLLRYTLLRNIP
jgi:Ca-activated chloride channel family protein